MDEIDLAFGERLRKTRKWRGLTLQQLGERADVNFKFCGEVERGNSGVSLSTAYRLAHALDVPLDRLVGQPLGPGTAGLIREAAAPAYEAKASALFRVVASIRHWTEDELLQLESLAKALRKGSPRRPGRRRGPPK